ncbi:FAD-dependent oxidoreductase [Vibrio viridaestus]|uniref:FAD-binding oxidoreductase n=1 Tax=Vibrio viridaestus TaxID=2487322 RepID=A0A3N9TKJ8_9VIBR|nr:FAD-dependent oxidoreductase [Vibrio viridaestus]RQW64797.1 FAD-binding oxidoreductase [Vibrio viridaestus]
MGSKPTVAIIGGGVAGATVAVHLAEIGINVHLIERQGELVNGPPICHLHAGGNLYREISEQQCIELLKQSIESIRLYPQTINVRPTIIAVPKIDSGSPETIIQRLDVIRDSYAELVHDDPKNKILGEPDNYYTLFSREELEQLARLEQPSYPQTTQDWVIPFAKSTDLSKLQFPVICVQEYGWSVFRLGASAVLALQNMPNAHLHLNSEFTHLENENDGWSIAYMENKTKQKTLHADYLINACGYETGKVDDKLQAKRKRYVEFKAAYVANWAANPYHWPEVIFHGERGTPNGMAQLTPYADGVFQLHGMTEDITLFQSGLAESTSVSAQPKLPLELERKLVSGWDSHVANDRTSKAIHFLANYIPEFDKAVPDGQPLFGAQQIPGDDATLRAADVSFEGDNYARVEIVKGSSAYEAARKIVKSWRLAEPGLYQQSIEVLHPIITGLEAAEIEALAIEMAQKRGYPIGLAKVVGM